MTAPTHRHHPVPTPCREQLILREVGQILLIQITIGSAAAVMTMVVAPHAMVLWMAYLLGHAGLLSAVLAGMALLLVLRKAWRNPAAAALPTLAVEFSVAITALTVLTVHAATSAATPPSPIWMLVGALTTYAATLTTTALAARRSAKTDRIHTWLMRLTCWIATFVLCTTALMRLRAVCVTTSTLGVA